MIAARSAAVAVILAAVGVGGCGSPNGGGEDSPGGPILLEPQEVFARYDWWDNRDWDWYEERIPFFDSPDEEINATYYYRWELLTKHLTYGSPQTGYVFTEFTDRPFWSGTYGPISCPLGHQHYEIRWLKDARIIDDFARYWFETPGAEPRSYSNWYGDAMWATYKVKHDPEFLRTVFPYMEQQYQGWVDERYDPEHGMFHWVGAWDGMEFNINSRQTVDEFGGASGYRPTLNSYMYADAVAIANAAEMLGDPAKAVDYRERASRLKQRVQEELWDPEREFFHHQFAHDEKDGIQAKTLTYQTGPYAGNPHGRELLGYVPWQFNLPDPGYEAAWKFLMDPEFFAAPFGPTTVERHDPLFKISATCCEWSGNQWPYATTQTLAAMANLLNDYEQNYVTREDYFSLLLTYTLDQRMDDRPFIAEAANPDNGSWDGHNTLYHSEHYFHSAYNDLIISGLVGLRPRADDVLVVNPLAPPEWDYFALDGVEYHGYDLTIAWDRDGSKYGRGAGLMVFIDGEMIAQTPALGRLEVALPTAGHSAGARSASRKDRLHNFAVNNDGGFFPHISASFSAPGTPPSFANDGNYWYTISPSNRWTTGGSPNVEDWIQVDFGTERPVSAVKLYFLEDSGNGSPAGGLAAGGERVSERTGDSTIAVPADFRLEAWIESDWQEVPDQIRRPEDPTGHRANTVTFPTLLTSRIRATFMHRPGHASGLTEFEAWGSADLPLPPPTGPITNLAITRDAEFPKVSASFTSRYDRIGHVNDGLVSFTRYQRNRWTAFESPNPTDWIEIDFGKPRAVGRLELYLWGDDRGVAAPADYEVHFWDGSNWAPAVRIARTPEQPATWAVNTIRIEPVETQRIRVVLEHALPLVSGLTELTIWEK